MAEILIKATDHALPDPDLDRSGAYKRGYPVEVRPDGAGYGKKERLPLFVVLKIPGVSVEAIQNYTQTWDIDIDYSVVASNSEGYRLKVTCPNISVSGKAAITRNQVEGSLQRWNAIVHSTAPNEVTFDITLFGAASSEALWPHHSSLVFTELASDATKVQAECDYSALSVVITDEAKLKNLAAQSVTGNKGTVLSNEGGKIQFEIAKSDLYQQFKDDVRQSVQKTYCRRRFYFPAAAMDLIEDNGGVMEVTAQQATTYLKDKLDE